MTPIYRSETFSQLCRREVHLKAENLQRTGSFKVRGAVNKLATLTDAERADLIAYLVSLKGPANGGGGRGRGGRGQ